MFYVNIQSTCFIATFLYLFCSYSLPSFLPPPISLTVLAAPSWILQPTHVYHSAVGSEPEEEQWVESLGPVRPISTQHWLFPLCRAVGRGWATPSTRTVLSPAHTEGKSKPGKPIHNSHWNTSTKDSRKSICGSYQCSVLSGMIKERRSLQNVIWVL